MGGSRRDRHTRDETGVSGQEHIRNPLGLAGVADHVGGWGRGGEAAMGFIPGVKTRRFIPGVKTRSMASCWCCCQGCVGLEGNQAASCPRAAWTGWNVSFPSLHGVTHGVAATAAGTSSLTPSTPLCPRGCRSHVSSAESHCRCAGCVFYARRGKGDGAAAAV